MPLPMEMPADLHKAISGFCEKDPEDLQLLDVLSVTETMALCLRDLFASDDTPIYASSVMLAAFTHDACKRLQNVRPDALRNDHIPLARDELEAIVDQTEKATETIMELTEGMLELDPEDANYADTITNSLLQIFEACSFQDLTGQRASRVSDTIELTSDQMDHMAGVLGNKHDETVGPAQETTEDARRRENILNGPQVSELAVSQDEVDQMIDQDDIDSLFD